MTDREVIARFMEPTPKRNSRSKDSQSGWWRYCGLPASWKVTDFGWRGDSLDSLREVEERLTDEQWSWYERQSRGWLFGDVINSLPRILLHATAEQKIKALAAVLRPIVEKTA